MPDMVCPLDGKKWKVQAALEDVITSASSAKLAFFTMIKMKRIITIAPRRELTLKDGSKVTLWCPPDMCTLTVGDVVTIWEATGFWVIKNIIRPGGSKCKTFRLHVEKVPATFKMPADIGEAETFMADMSTRGGMLTSSIFSEKSDITPDRIVYNFGERLGVTVEEVQISAVRLAEKVATANTQKETQRRSERRLREKEKRKAPSGPVSSSTTSGATTESRQASRRSTDSADIDDDFEADVSVVLSDDDEEIRPKKRTLKGTHDIIPEVTPPPPPSLTSLYEEQQQVVRKAMGLADKVDGKADMSAVEKRYVNSSQVVLPARRSSGGSRQRTTFPGHSDESITLAPQYIAAFITPMMKPFQDTIQHSQDLLQNSQQLLADQVREMRQFADKHIGMMHTTLAEVQRANAIQTDKMSATLSACVERIAQSCDSMAKSVAEIAQANKDTIGEKDKHTLELARIVSGKPSGNK